MPKYRYNGLEVEAVPQEDWGLGELSEAEHALGVALDGSSAGDALAIAFYISVRRVDKEIHKALLGDAAKAIKMSDLLDSEEPAPLDEAVEKLQTESPASPETSGPPASDNMESRSLSRI